MLICESRRVTQALEERDFTRPQASDLVDSLTTVLGSGAAQLALTRAVREAKLRSEIGAELQEQLAHLDLEELIVLSETMTRQRGLVSVLARSFAIRAHSYAAIERTEHG